MSCNKKVHLLFVGVIILWALVANVQGITIYVDAGNAGSPTMDGSELDPWDTVSKGVTNLVAVNSGSPGGHTVLVKAGTYNERVDITADASGIDGSLNTILADGVVTINNAYPIVTTANYIIIDGFTLTGSALGAIGASGNDGLRDSIIRNCSFPDMGTTEARKCGISLYSAGDGLLISNCFFRTQGCGILVTRGNSQKFTVADSIFYNIQSWAIGLYTAIGTQATVTNCIFVGSGSYAFYKRQNDGSKFEGHNNLIWGSGSANVADESAGEFYNTETEINALNTASLVFSNNIVANPGFANAWDNWDFNAFYENSPCLKENNGFARHIGPYQNPVIRPTPFNTYYVKPAGNDGADGLSLENAWSTLTKAASVAVAGDTVRLQDGVYQESVLITSGGSGNATVKYVADGDVTIDANGAAYAIKALHASGVELDGLKITGATDGVFLEYSPGAEIRNSSLYGNTRGLRMDYSPACLLEGLQIFNNTSEGIRSTIYKASGSTLSRSSIFSNQRGIYIGTFSTGWLIKNCNIYSNTDTGIYDYYTMYSYYNISSGGIPTRIFHCDILDNTNYGVYVNYDIPTVHNCIISSNGVGVFEATASSDAFLLNNCFYNNNTNFYDEGTTVRDTAVDINAVAGCSDNIVADPRFRNAAGYDLRLASDSPCVDAGSPTIPPVEFDFFGRPRKAGGEVDIGSYELPVAGALFMSF